MGMYMLWHQCQLQHRMQRAVCMMVLLGLVRGNCSGGGGG